MKESLVYRGSVKDIYQTENNYLRFEFSNRYSVFDWGEMPDAIAKKGDALNYLSCFFFKHLGNPLTWQNWSAPQLRDNALKSRLYNSRLLKEFAHDGCPHHFIKKSSHNSHIVKKILVPKINIKDFYSKRPIDALVPLEVVFRFGVPEGSSFLSRGQDQSYIDTLGINSSVNPGQMLEKPVIEFFTKLEPIDRFLDYQEASRLAGMTPFEMDELKNFATLLALELKNIFDGLEIELWDGKFEFAFHQLHDRRSFKLVDSIGPDELRLSKNGCRISKEYLRQIYRQTDWYPKLQNAQTLSNSDWKQKMIEDGDTPKPLNKDQLEGFKKLYLGLCNDLARSQGSAIPFAGEYTLKGIKP